MEGKKSAASASSVDFYGGYLANVMTTPAPGMDMSSMASSSATMPRPTPMRPLPGYAMPKIPSTTMATSASMARIKTDQMPTNPLPSRPYRTRERLFWETDDSIKGSIDGEKDVKTTSVMDRLAEDAPPVVSLRDLQNTLSPERKFGHLPLNDKEGRENNMDVDAMMAMMPPTPVRLVETRLEVGEGNWVTVFGFAGSQASAVLDYFASLGTIEVQEMGQGNWMHIKYSTLWSAQRALAKNGSILPIFGACMIGVVPANRAVENVKHAADSFMSPIKKESLEMRKPPPTQGSITTGAQESVMPKDIFIKSNLMTPRPGVTTTNVKSSSATNTTTAAATTMGFRTPAANQAPAATPEIFRAPPTLNASSKTAAAAADQRQIFRPTASEPTEESQSLLSKAVGLVLGW